MHTHGNTGFLLKLIWLRLIRHSLKVQHTLSHTKGIWSCPILWLCHHCLTNDFSLNVESIQQRNTERQTERGVCLWWQYPYLRCYDMWRWQTIFGKATLRVCVCVSVHVHVFTVYNSSRAMECLSHIYCSSCAHEQIQTVTMAMESIWNTAQTAHTHRHFVIRRSGYEWSLPFQAREFPFLNAALLN